MYGSSSFSASFFGALEGSISVLLTLAAGYYVGHSGLIDHSAVRKVSKLCSNLFLPCLIIQNMGPELTVANLRRLWILPVWGLVSTIIAHLIGWAGKAIFKTPHWVIVAAGRPNTSALPLLLLQSLESTGVLKSLASSGEDTSKLLSRAQSIILLNVVVQQTLTFQLAPSILKRDDGKHADEEDGDLGPSTLTPSSPKGKGRINPIVQDRERVGLLRDYDGQSYGARDQHDDVYTAALEPIADTPDIHWPERIAFLEQPLKCTWNMMSPPLIGALIALFLGLIPPLHDAFFEEGSALYSSVTQSLENLGELFVSLQMFIVGAQLALLPNTHPGIIPTTFSMLVRFVVMPALSLGFVWLTAGRGWYVDDKLVWFLLVLVPTGPSAMLLANVAELVRVDQGPIAGYLTVSYLFSPLMAVVCSLGLIVVDNVSKRNS